MKQTVKFKLDGKPVQFEIIHNLKEAGYKLETVIHNWIPRATNYDDRDLVTYINSKSHMTDCYAMTIEDYEKILANQ